MYRVESAKMLATLLHGMKGTPYIYQGEELGMTNIHLNTIEEYEDIETLNMYKERIEKGESHEDIMTSIYAKSRDNARTPMQWDSTEHAGFTTGNPWFAINPNYDTINAANALADENSIFYHYQKLIALRKEREIFTEGDFRMLCMEHPSVFAYERVWKDDRILVVCNFYGEEVSISLESELQENLPGRIVLSNYPDSGEDYYRGLKLRPYEAVMYELG